MQHQEAGLGLWNAELLRVAGILARERHQLAVGGLIAGAPRDAIQRAMDVSNMDSVVSGDHSDAPVLVRQVGVATAPCVVVVIPLSLESALLCCP